MRKKWFVALVVGSEFLFACDQLGLFNEEILPGEITEYVIPTGEHYAKQSSHQSVEAEPSDLKHDSTVPQFTQPYKRKTREISTNYSVSQTATVHIR